MSAPTFCLNRLGTTATGTTHPVQLDIDRSSTACFNVRAGKDRLVTNLHRFVAVHADILHDSGHCDWRIEHNHAGASVDSLDARV